MTASERNNLIGNYATEAVKAAVTGVAVFMAVHWFSANGDYSSRLTKLETVVSAMAVDISEIHSDIRYMANKERGR